MNNANGLNFNVIGGGPAGLYFSILMKSRNPAHRIRVIERDGPNDTFGWGIVFSDQTFSWLEENDAPSYERIMAHCEIWDNVDIVHRGEKITIRGNRFSGIGRLQFLNILHDRCRELGVELLFQTNATDIETFRDCDLLIGADGSNSLVRRTYQDYFQPSVEIRKNKFIWLGTPQLFHGLTLTFRENEAGQFIAHSYKFNSTTSTFIVECDETTWQNAGFASKSEADTCAYLEQVFADDLDGHPLLTNNFVQWRNFPLVRNARWHHENVVLLGDALHTAHFSIGSGTKLALEDAITLASCFHGTGSVSDLHDANLTVDEAQVAHAPRSVNAVTSALREFEYVRKPVVERLQDAAMASLLSFENIRDDWQLEPLPFAYKMMSRSGRITHEKLKQRDPDFVAAYEHWLLSQK